MLGPLRVARRINPASASGPSGTVFSRPRPRRIRLVVFESRESSAAARIGRLSSAGWAASARAIESRSAGFF